MQKGALEHGLGQSPGGLLAAALPELNSQHLWNAGEEAQGHLGQNVIILVTREWGLELLL